VSHTTLAAVQNLPDVFPDVPIWQSGSVGSAHALLSAHIVVHAANMVGLVMQLKQVVPALQGWPQSGTNVVHLPCRQVTPAWSANRRREPSSQERLSGALDGRLQSRKKFQEFHQCVI